MDVDALQVDSYLSSFIEGLKSMSTIQVHSPSPAPVVPPAPQPWGIIPPQTAQHQVRLRGSCMSGTHHTTGGRECLCVRLHGCCKHMACICIFQFNCCSHYLESPVQMLTQGFPCALPQGKLTVFLDLDGTLVSSFTPKRAPRLPPSVKSHLVGIGSQLNPSGVFVVERPGLTEFLRELASFTEVIVYTAGLEDYAKPIVDALDPTGELFAARIYREGTLRTDYYQCVKDMARLNRSLSRCVLVDDTPLAFLHQPSNGVPVLGFRGDPDDRLLLEAVLPLLQVGCSSDFHGFSFVCQM